MSTLIIFYFILQMAVKLWASKAPGERQSERDITLLKNKKKVIKMLVIVVVSFCIAWLPLQAYYLLAVTWPSINEYKHIQIIFLCCDWLAMSNSCYNPFIYGIYNVSIIHTINLFLNPYQDANKMCRYLKFEIQLKKRSIYL
jgi:leucokinin receptor